MLANVKSENKKFKLLPCVSVISFWSFLLLIRHTVRTLTAGHVDAACSSIYKTVRHLAKDDAHERKHHPVGHCHHSPHNHHQNVTVVCKPELNSEKFGYNENTNCKRLLSPNSGEAGGAQPKQQEDVLHSPLIAPLPFILYCTVHTYTYTHTHFCYDCKNTLFTVFQH